MRSAHFPWSRSGRKSCGDRRYWSCRWRLRAARWETFREAAHSLPATLCCRRSSRPVRSSVHCSLRVLRRPIVVFRGRGAAPSVADFNLRFGRRRCIQLDQGGLVVQASAAAPAKAGATIRAGGSGGACGRRRHDRHSALLGRIPSAAPATRQARLCSFRISWSGPFWLGLTTLASKLAGNRVSRGFRNYALSRTGRN